MLYLSSVSVLEPQSHRKALYSRSPGTLQTFGCVRRPAVPHRLISCSHLSSDSEAKAYAQPQSTQRGIPVQEFEQRNTTELWAILQAVQDSIRALPREAMDASQVRELRSGTAVAKARDLIKSAGHPLHITDILKGLGKPVDTKSKLSLSGSLAGYVREGQIFNRPAPNTFGLIEFPISNGSEEIPDDFGKM